MSAINYWDDPEICPNCSGENITPSITLGADVDEQNRYVSVDGYKCYDCHERWQGLSPMNTWAIETYGEGGGIVRYWQADDEAHAVEQHNDSFPDEGIIEVWEITS